MANPETEGNIAANGAELLVHSDHYSHYFAEDVEFSNGLHIEPNCEFKLVAHNDKKVTIRIGGAIITVSKAEFDKVILSS